MSSSKHSPYDDSPEDSPKHAATSEEAPRHGSRLRSAGRILGCTAGVFVAVVVLVLLGASLWLTPSRLSSLINREASQWLEADVKISDVRFTLWSSFPHFCIDADSLRVTSRSLGNLSKAQKDSLPGDAENLLSTGYIHGSLNLLSLLKGTISMRDLEVAYIDLNLVDLNDSINNYSILPSDSNGSFRIPRFTTNSLRLLHTRPIRYFSAASGSRLVAPLDSAKLLRIADDRYRLVLGGRVSFRSGSLEVLREFPFLLNGLLSTDFHPFSLRLSDFNVALADIKGKADLDFVVGENPAINRFSYSIDHVDPFSLLSYLPAESLPFLREVKADLPVTLSARLTAPYHFSASALPSVAVDFHTWEGSMEYDFGGQSPLRLSDIALDGSFDFDGRNPDKSMIEISNLSMRSEGSSMKASASVNDLTTVPLVNIAFEGRADLSSLASNLPMLSSIRMQGMADADANIMVSIPSSPGALPEVSADGSVALRRLSLGAPGNMSVAADSLLISFLSTFSPAAPDSIAVKKFVARVSADNTSLISPDFNLVSGPIDLSVSALSPFTLGNSATPDIPPCSYALDLKRPVLTERDRPSSKLRSDHIAAEGSVGRTSGHYSADMALSVATIRFSDESGYLLVGPVNATASVRPYASSQSRRPAMSAPKQADSEALARLPHTPEYLALKLPDAFRRFYETHTLNLSMSVAGGDFYTPSFPAVSSFAGPDISFSSDTFSFSRLSLRSQKSAASLSASVSGLRDFIVSSLPVPLDASLSLAIDTLSINQLARTYAEGLKLTRGSSASLSAPKPATLSASDSTAMLIPRNLSLRLDASAKETVYTNLHLYDLAASADVKDGLLHIPSLSISSDFGKADFSLSYNSANILALNLGMDANVLDIDLVTFFKRFHTLLLMMPQMKNLSGFISAEASLGLNIWPDMYADVPSLSARMAVQGRELKVHQDAFIRRITRMLLIPTASDIHIANMDIRASIHDNLLELYPFTFAFDRYRLSMQGINNLNGRLYYHVGILDSPLHLPFGINITGMFSHPHLRFGGAHYKVDEGAKVARDVMVPSSFNIIREAKYFLNEFVRKAAEADDTPASAFGNHPLK